MSRDEAWAEWVRSSVDRYQGPLLLYAVRLAGSTEAAQDIVQETFLRLCSQDRAAIEARLNVWLFSVCRNHALEVRRKQSRMTEFTKPMAESVPASNAPVGHRLENRESLAEVMTALSKLPENQQEVIRLKFEHGLSYREISEITKLTVTNVGFMIHTGLKRIRERVSGDRVAATGGVGSVGVGQA
jgi:RNA polymerase sigma factor (sigma-70 family)